jgi:hypothetical protein
MTTLIKNLQDRDERNYNLRKILEASSVSNEVVEALQQQVNLLSVYSGFYDNYNDLIANETAGEAGRLFYLRSSQGTSWLPSTLGGTYYPSGAYLDTGSAFVSDRNAIVAELENIVNGVYNTNAYRLETSNYTATLNDYHIECTGTFTLSFVSIAGLKKSWVVTNSGTGIITLDPNGSETINGEITINLEMGEGESVTLRSDEVDNLIIT